MKTPKTDRNNLSVAEMYRLCRWLDTHKDRLMRDCPSRDRTAEEARTELGFAITGSNIKAAQEAAGVTWRQREVATRREGVRSRLVALEGRVTTLEETASKLRSDVQILRGLVHSLYRSLGENPPPGYVIPPGVRDTLDLSLVNKG